MLTLIKKIAKILNFRNAKPILRTFSSVKAEAQAPDLNQPIKFSGSSAHVMKSMHGRQGTMRPEDVPGYQTYYVVGSVAIFLIYFCILREESDIDLELEKSLYDQVPGMEHTQLVINYKYNLENNKDNTAIVARMKELDMKPEDIRL